MNSILTDKQTINQEKQLRYALEKLNQVPDNLTLFVLDSNQVLVGSLTDGDVRRGLLMGLTLDDTVELFMFRHFKYITEYNFSLLEIRQLKDSRIKLVPMVDKDMHIIRLIDMVKYKSVLPLDVIIMAGGKGERLKPLTDNMPKPLLKVGDTPILEHNLNHIISYGINRIHISVNYLGNMIMNYFGDGSSRNIDIKYINEDQPLGTLGAATLMEEINYDHILVMNADVLTNIDLEDFFKEHLEQDALMSIASVPYKVNMPFAVLETAENRVMAFTEKPEYTYYTNAGIYLIHRSLLSRIPSDTMYHATDLMQDILNKKEKLMQYSIHGFWMDIGRKEDFQKAQTEIKHFYTK